MPWSNRSTKTLPRYVDKPQYSGPQRLSIFKKINMNILLCKALLKILVSSQILLKRSFSKLSHLSISYNHVAQHSKYHRKVLLSGFHLNGHTLGFHPKTQSWNHLVQHDKQYHRKVLLGSFHMNGHTFLQWISKTVKRKNFTMYSSFKNIGIITNTAKYVFSKWSYLRLSSTNSKVIITFYSIMDITTGKHCLVQWSDQTTSFTGVKDNSRKVDSVSRGRAAVGFY